MTELLHRSNVILENDDGYDDEMPNLILLLLIA
jgi:hypothetical protein